jgi:uncharacterized membrane protein YccF (DUF307 family)
VTAAGIASCGAISAGGAWRRRTTLLALMPTALAAARRNDHLAGVGSRRRHGPAVGDTRGHAMSLLSLLLNVLWMICGGIYMAVGWLIAAAIMAITIIGIPWARAAFNIAAYTLLPFGHRAVSRADYFGRDDFGTGPFGMLGNIVWLLLAGWWLALGHLITAILLAITLIGIPFAWAHLKLAGLALWPIGKVIVPTDSGPQRFAP